jgi:hypothetical protein
MVIWINGAFGAGKTTIARRLVRIHADACLFDPEQIGFMLRRVWPDKSFPDFQDLPIWRELTLRTLMAAAHGSRRVLVVPMSLANPDYFNEIVGGLRAEGIDVRHFTLMAPAATIRRRIWRRLSFPASKRWALSHVEAGVAGLAAAEFATHIQTDDRAVSRVAEDILSRVLEQDST